jgi:DNA-binding NtrC family response regulator
LESLGVKVIVSKEAHLNVILDALREYAALTPVSAARILVVDDEPDICRIVSVWFTRRGYTVLTASNGSQALHLLEHNGPIDLVVLDVRIPEIGGMEVMARISTWPSRPEVIVMTAIEDTEIAQHARRLGAFDYIVKPVDLDALGQLVVAGLAHAEYQKQHWWSRLTRLTLGRHAAAAATAH